jgi:ParB family protein of integrating conjugative element (PFGI_1 class)
VPDLTPQDMEAKLLAAGFERSGPVVAALSDPIADTPMVVTLDQLRPYELDPRVTRNPRFDEIKASIRERGLDAPPAITRRPGAPAYIIRNGGNTRLAILRELWAETKDDRFFRIHCLFRPWPERGDIVALTGHLAENELHGGLSFIERALGIEKVRELYEQTTGGTLTQTELSRRLAADGYPVPQSHISRMQDAVHYLLPAIPSVLYGGLGRPQVERLTILRRASARIWEQRVRGKILAMDFPTLFQEVLALFNTESTAFSVKRVQDELVGQMAELLDADYDTLTLEIDDTETRQRVLSGEPTLDSTLAPARLADEPIMVPPATTSASMSEPPSVPRIPAPAKNRTNVAPPQDSHRPETEPVAQPTLTIAGAQGEPVDQWTERLQGHIVSPATTTDRLQSIQRLVADHAGDTLPDFGADVLRAIPVQVGGLYPITDVWYIELGLDAPDRLRIHIAQFAREIAQEAALAESVEFVEDGIGFVCIHSSSSADTQPMLFFPRAVLSLLHAMSSNYRRSTGTPAGREALRLADDLGPLLQGSPLSNDAQTSASRLSDAGLVKFFRMIRLARRLLELEAGIPSLSPEASEP